MGKNLYINSVYTWFVCAGSIYLKSRTLDRDLPELGPDHALVVHRVWKFSQTENRVAGTVRAGAVLHGYARFNFVKVQIDGVIEYMELRCLMKIGDVGQGASLWERARKLHGKLWFLGCYLEPVPGRRDGTGQLKLRWATAPTSRRVGGGTFWYQVRSECGVHYKCTLFVLYHFTEYKILQIYTQCTLEIGIQSEVYTCVHVLIVLCAYQVMDSGCILESVVLIPIPLKGAAFKTDNGDAAHIDREFYVHTVGRSATGES